MRIVQQDQTNPGQMLFAFDDIVDDRLSELRWAVAYTGLKGGERVARRIIDRAGELQWDQAEKTLVTCFDYGITDPEALKFLKEDIGIKIRIANVEVLKNPLLRPRNAFHPKMYLCSGSRILGLVGSANLTLSAMTSNTEAGVICTVPHDIWEDSWNAIVDRAVALDEPLLTTYREARKRAPASRPDDPDESPPVVQVDTDRLPVLWDAIQNQQLDPESFGNLWIEAGSMSSGGSHSQLELPRGANRFFGFEFEQYDNEHATIGHPNFWSFAHAWTDRPLTWHGENGMERINLPTEAQGGFEYRMTVILFRRRTDGFELVVTPSDDPLALSWRNASALLGNTYKLGRRSNRTCGLF